MSSVKARVRAQRTQGRSAGGGLHVMVKTHPSGRTTISKIDLKKLDFGTQLRGVCIHHVGGAQRATLTALRRKRIHVDHAKTVDATGKCSMHVHNWKRKAVVCGSI